MQITRAEAKEIREYLMEEGRWGEGLWARLREVVKEYRLETEIPRMGSRANLRRTYTCPFYTPGPKGCGLPAEVKPFGCLAFNPVQVGAMGLSSGCRSDQTLLREQAKSHEASTEELKPIPLALLQLL